MEQKPEIFISSDELQAPAIDHRVEQMRLAAQTELVRQVGAPTAQRSLAKNPILQGVGLGVVSGLIASIVVEIVGQPQSPSPWYGTNNYVSTIFIFGLFALLFTIPFTIRDGVEARSSERAFRDLGLGILIIAGPALFGALIAQYAYSHLMYLVRPDPYSYSYNHVALHFLRGFAWAIVSLAAGLGLGLTKKALRPVINGAVGGFVGGFVGGAVFDFLPSGTSARIVGLTIIGGLIGVSIGLVDQLTKQHWIEIVSGGMAGKQFILFLSRTTLGSSPGADITLIKDPLLAGEHAVLTTQGKNLVLASMSQQAPVQVNGVPISTHQLSDGDLVQLGATVLRYRTKSEEMPTWN